MGPTTSPLGPGIDFSQPIIPFIFPAAQIVPLFVMLVFTLWAVYTVVAFYHWLRYGDSVVVAFGAMGIHLVISTALAIFAVSGL